MNRNPSPLRLLPLLLLIVLRSMASEIDPKRQFLPPQVEQISKRLVSIEDVSALRGVAALRVSPKKQRFIVCVYQRDVAANDYRAGWYVGDVKRMGELVYLADAGELTFNGADLVSQEVRWSPNEQWIAYTKKHGGEIQLWRSRLDGTQTEQITHNAADVREFEWNEEGTVLYFKVDTPRAEQARREQEKMRNGYQYDSDLYHISYFMAPDWTQSSETSSLTLWVVAIQSGHEKLASDAEQLAYRRITTPGHGAAAQHTAEVTGDSKSIEDGSGLRVVRPDGAAAWLEYLDSSTTFARVVATFIGEATPIRCISRECSGYVTGLWWSEVPDQVLFMRRTGIGLSSTEVLGWNPRTGKVSKMLQTVDDDYQFCGQGIQDRLICVRETPTWPAHIVAIDSHAGTVQTLADLNPEFRDIRLGQVERFEWDTPQFDWSKPGGRLEGVYPARAFGYILYPPDFNPHKKYPVFVDPYHAQGFESSVGHEHAQHVYAANGFIVLKTNFPLPDFEEMGARFGRNTMREIYSSELDFPHLTMLSESTVVALKMIARRGFIDIHRVGIGGVSHGSFVPMYMLIEHDLIAAISISSPDWTPIQYYTSTARTRELVAASSEEFLPKPEGHGREFYRRIDLADQIDEIEAPILMNLAAAETLALTPLIRGMADAGKPYDAYIFPNETHLKWQPAHLHAINHRNLDWFRFWLQDYMDSDPAKAEQYSRWRKLYELHRESLIRKGKNHEKLSTEIKPRR
jgi:dipeptidyl aminopeptidase/acylaminoacyl peptidase